MNNVYPNPKSFHRSKPQTLLIALKSIKQVPKQFMLQATTGKQEVTIDSSKEQATNHHQQPRRSQQKKLKQ